MHEDLFNHNTGRKLVNEEGSNRNSGSSCDYLATNKRQNCLLTEDKTMKLTAIVRPHEKVDIENVTLFVYDSDTQVLEYWLGQYDLRRLTHVRGVQAVEEEKEED